MLKAIDELQEILGVGAVVLTAALALTLGGKPHRWAGALALLDGFGLALLSAQLPHADRFVLVQIKAAAVLGAYAALTWRWSASWLILLTALQTTAVLLHAAAWLDRSIVAPVNALLLNGVGWLMLLVLAAAAVMARFARAQSAIPADRAP